MGTGKQAAEHEEGGHPDAEEETKESLEHHWKPTRAQRHAQDRD